MDLNDGYNRVYGYLYGPVWKVVRPVCKAWNMLLPSAKRGCGSPLIALCDSCRRLNAKLIANSNPKLK